MARIRTIKPEFWTDERLTECSVTARLLIIGMLNFADDNGNQPYSSKRLKMQIFPADAIDVQPFLNELLTHGMVIAYSVNGEKFLHIKGFRKHQVINRPSATKIPMPSFTDDSLSPPCEGTDDSLTEGKGKEGSNTPIPPAGAEDKVEKKTSAVALPTWLAAVKDAGEKVIPDTDPVFDYADQVGIPIEFLHLCWKEFRARYSQPNAKRYKDWRSVFRKAVRGNWLKLWWVDNNGNYMLTTVGKQAEKAAA